jgi:inward rectifier potassium channel
VAEPTKQPPPPAQIRLFASDAQRRLRVINVRPPGLRDMYHLLLRASWGRTVVVAALVFLVINALFGLAYWGLGGITNARADSFADHFFFSVHTFGTIGYGSMYPQTTTAEMLVTFESFVSLFLNALVTGLVFAKFARPTARLLWTNKAVVSDREGVPTLMFRVANERRNHVVEATIRAAVVRAEVTREGESLRRVIDLPLVRASSPTFILTWTVMHQITRDSPLYGLSPAQVKQMQSEIVLTLTGLDETLGQTINDRTSFIPEEVVWGARFGDVLSGQGGERVLDYGKFHDVRPATLTWSAMGVTPDPS